MPEANGFLSNVTPVILTYNEAANIGRALSKLTWASEVLIVDSFSDDGLKAVREWLFGKAASIYGGSYEIQNNIISKNILGLPETTQKG